MGHRAAVLRPRLSGSRGDAIGSTAVIGVAGASRTSGLTGRQRRIDKSRAARSTCVKGRNLAGRPHAGRSQRSSYHASVSRCGDVRRFDARDKRPGFRWRRGRCDGDSISSRGGVDRHARLTAASRRRDGAISWVSPHAQHRRSVVGLRLRAWASCPDDLHAGGCPRRGSQTPADARRLRTLLPCALCSDRMLRQRVRLRPGRRRRLRARFRADLFATDDGARGGSGSTRRQSHLAITSPIVVG